MARLPVGTLRLHEADAEMGCGLASPSKRQALDALDVQRGRVLPAAGNGGDPQNAEIRAVIDVPESVTSQSRHSLTLSGSPPHGKLLIPLERRDVRVVEGARLEIALAVSDGVLQISITVAKPTT